jgi:hypothetical protein
MTIAATGAADTAPATGTTIASINIAPALPGAGGVLRGFARLLAESPLTAGSFAWPVATASDLPGTAGRASDAAVATGASAAETTGGLAGVAATTSIAQPGFLVTAAWPETPVARPFSGSDAAASRSLSAASDTAATADPAAAVSDPRMAPAKAAVSVVAVAVKGGVAAATVEATGGAPPLSPEIAAAVSIAPNGAPRADSGTMAAAISAISPDRVRPADAGLSDPAPAPRAVEPAAFPASPAAQASNAAAPDAGRPTDTAPAPAPAPAPEAAPESASAVPPLDHQSPATTALAPAASPAITGLPGADQADAPLQTLGDRRAASARNRRAEPRPPSPHAPEPQPLAVTPIALLDAPPAPPTTADSSGSRLPPGAATPALPSASASVDAAPILPAPTIATVASGAPMDAEGAGADSTQAPVGDPRQVPVGNASPAPVGDLGPRPALADGSATLASLGALPGEPMPKLAAVADAATTLAAPSAETIATDARSAIRRGGAAAGDGPPGARPPPTDALARGFANQVPPADALTAPVAAAGAAPAPPLATAFAAVAAQPLSLSPPPQPSLLPQPAILALPVQPETLARDIGFAVAHRIGRDGDELRIRLSPADFGTVDVRLSFDDRGSLRAIVGADSPAALDILRRDAAELGRALTDAGVRADDRSFRFENRADGQNGAASGQQADARGQRGDGQPQGRAPGRPNAAFAEAEFADAATAPPHPLAWRGGINVIA